MPADAWAHRSGPYRGLAYRFVIGCSDAELGRHIDHLLTSLRDDTDSGSPDVQHYGLSSSSQGTVTLWRNDDRVAELVSAGHALEWLLWDINQRAAASSDDLLLLHAGAVQVGEVAVVLPSPSGGGKSTLVAGVVRDGARYLSDELVALTTEGTALPYPKPITLKAGSFDVLPELAPRPGDAERFGADEWQVRPDDIRPSAVGSACPLGAIVVPRHAPAEATRLNALSETDAFLALSINTVNLEQHGDRGTQQLAALARAIPAFQLTVSDLSTAGALVIQMVADSEATAAKPGQ